MSRPIVCICLLLALAQSALAAVPMGCIDAVVEPGCHESIVETSADNGCELRCAQAAAPAVPALAVAGRSVTDNLDYTFSCAFYSPPDTREIFHPPINP